jgi:ureidoglycolate lyase
MELVINDLTPENFAGFGKVIEQPSRPQDAEGPGWTWWGENALLEGDGKPYAVGYLDLKPTDLSFSWAERHMNSDELVIPVTGDILVYAGPADHPDKPLKLPALESFRVFRVRLGQAAILGKGVWHGAPLAVDSPAKAIVLLLQGSGRDDGYVVKFEDRPVRIVRIGE